MYLNCLDVLSHYCQQRTEITVLYFLSCQDYVSQNETDQLGFFESPLFRLDGRYIRRLFNPDLASSMSDMVVGSDGDRSLFF